MILGEINTKVCRKCGEEKLVGKFRIRRVVHGVAIDNICLACRGRAEFSRLKLEMLEALGGKCACCGETHPQFLTLEHLRGVAPLYYGRKRKYNVNTDRLQGNTYVEYRRAKRENWDPAKYACLCIGCNWAKGQFGECPHRSGITRERFLESLRQNMTGIGCTHRNPKGLGRFRKPSKKQIADALAKVEESNS